MTAHPPIPTEVLVAGRRALERRETRPTTNSEAAEIVIRAVASMLYEAWYTRKPCGARSRWFDATCSLVIHPASVAHEGRTPDGSLVVFTSTTEEVTIPTGGESVG